MTEGLFDNVDFYLFDLKSRFDKLDKSKYYLSYSGGKDSHFLYWFIKEYLKDNKIEIVGVNTYMEHDEIIQRIYKYSDKVLLPKLKPFEIKERYGIPCFTKTQDEFIDRFQSGSRSESTLKRFYGSESFGLPHSSFDVSKKARDYVLSDKAHKISAKCCKYLKKKPALDYAKATGKHAILGIRRSESKQRKAQYQSCFQKNGNFTPIYDMTDELEQKIYDQYQIEVPDIYKHVDRTGCAGCPYGTNVARSDTKTELQLVNENKRKFLIEYFKKSYDARGIKY